MFKIDTPVMRLILAHNPSAFLHVLGEFAVSDGYFSAGSGGNENMGDEGEQLHLPKVLADAMMFNVGNLKTPDLLREIADEMDARINAKRGKSNV